MGIPAEDQLEINTFVLSMNEVEHIHLRRVDVVAEGDVVTLSESTYFSNGWLNVPLAQLSRDVATGIWTLHCATVDGDWRIYSDAYPTNQVGPLLDEIDRDPRNVFWG
ncbi:MAG: DUF3024 domain-containing protein [Candidatus Nanopelagicales bacterium]